MSFLKPVAKVGTFGLAGMALAGKKKKNPLEEPVKQPSMISQGQRSLIGSEPPKRSIY